MIVPLTVFIIGIIESCVWHPTGSPSQLFRVVTNATEWTVSKIRRNRKCRTYNNFHSQKKKKKYANTHIVHWGCARKGHWSALGTHAFKSDRVLDLFCSQSFVATSLSLPRSKSSVVMLSTLSPNRTLFGCWKNKMDKIVLFSIPYYNTTTRKMLTSFSNVEMTPLSIRSWSIFRWLSWIASAFLKILFANGQLLEI